MPSPAPTGLVNLVLMVDGSELSSKFPVSSVYVNKEVNRIPYAVINILDGDPAAQKFELSEDSKLKPGADIEIKAGYDSSSSSIFKGTITKHSIKIRSGSSFLVIECKDKAIKMTLENKNVVYEKKKDSEIFSTLIGNASGVSSGTITATTYKHAQILQHDCTDWDFMISRAEHNSMLVIAEGNKINIEKPNAGSAALTLEYGTNIFEMEADIDAVPVHAKATATSWSISDQAVKKKVVSSATFTEAGNLGSSTINSVTGKDLSFYHSGTVEEAELKNWGESALLKSKMARYRGRVKSAGFSDILPGKTLELKGVGARFNGKVFVSGVKHEIVGGNWFTHTQFGVSKNWHTENYNINGKHAGGLIPPVHGLQIGKVKKLHSDPDSENRIQIALPMFDNKNVWARLIFADAGSSRGIFFMPELEDEVIVGFLNDDARYPVVLGTLYSSKAKPPVSPSDNKNNDKGIYSRSGIKLLFDDDKKIFTVKTPKGHSVELNDDSDTVTVKDKSGNKITMASSLLTIKGKQDVKISATGKITLDAKGDLVLNGMNIKNAAKMKFVADGKAGSDLTSSAIATIKGSLVKIN